MASLNIVFVKKKETKGTWVYEEQGSDLDTQIGVLYVKKHAVGKLGSPQTLYVTLNSDAPISVAAGDLA